MTKQLFLIDYECAHWCGGASSVVVWAIDEEDARCVASDHMEEEMRELYSDEYNDEYQDNEGSYDDESAVSVNSVEPFGPEHEAWKWFQDPVQSQFYPVVGEPT